MDIAWNFIQAAREQAERLGLRVKFSIGDMRNLPYPDCSFDKVVCLWSCFDDLLLRRDQLRAIRDVHRVLRPGGFAFIEMRNGEQKALRSLARSHGTGPAQRVIHETVEGIRNISFNHDRRTLRALCRQAHIQRFNVGFKNIAGRRRLVVIFHK